VSIQLSRFFRPVAATAISTILATGIAPAAAAPSQDTALEWYDTTVATIQADGAPTQITNNRTWAIGWLAAARAVRHAPPGPQQKDYQDAALAASVHDALVTLVPSQGSQLHAALDRTLSRIPNGPAKDQGVTAGRDEARAALESRAGDGLDPESVNAPFPTPQPAPGVWQPTPPQFSPAKQAGNRNARPFLLERAEQFRPGPPPEVGSERYRADLGEVRAYGAAHSPVRTPQQTETATFWLGSSLITYNGVLRAALEQSDRPLGARIELVAIFHAILVDTQIATSDTKYAYVSWRPVTAIRSGDPSTPADPNWEPLHETPAHPDYVSGHNTYSGAAEEVLTELTGSDTAEPFTLTSTTAPGVSRTYTKWRQLTEEDTDARVWSGIHTRTADKVGVELGRDVAEHGLRTAKRLFD
jgi:hypothetical protein